VTIAIEATAASGGKYADTTLRLYGAIHRRSAAPGQSAGINHSYGYATTIRQAITGGKDPINDDAKMGASGRPGTTTPVNEG